MMIKRDVPAGGKVDAYACWTAMELDFAYAKSAPEMARWSNTHCPNAVCRLKLMLFRNF